MSDADQQPTVPLPGTAPTRPFGHQAPAQPQAQPVAQSAQPAPAHGATQVPLSQAHVPAAPTQLAQPAASAQYPVQHAQTAPATNTTLSHTNTYALVAIILGFLAPLGGIIFGHLALGQIKRNGDAGRGLALTGLIIGYAYFVMIALLIITYIGFVVMMFASIGLAFNDFDSSYYDYS